MIWVGGDADALVFPSPPSIADAAATGSCDVLVDVTAGDPAWFAAAFGLARHLAGTAGRIRLVHDAGGATPDLDDLDGWEAAGTSTRADSVSVELRRVAVQ